MEGGEGLSKISQGLLGKHYGQALWQALWVDGAEIYLIFFQVG